MRLILVFSLALALLTLGAPTGNGKAANPLLGKGFADTNGKGPIAMSSADDENDEEAWPFTVPDEEEQIDDEENQGEEEQSPEEEAPPEEEPSEDPQDQQIFTPPDLNPEISKPGELPETDNWLDVPGKKVSFFFLVDPNDSDNDPAYEPEAVHLKALKYADQVLSGISFKYDPAQNTVYLADNINAIPENIQMMEKTTLQGVVRYDYQVALPTPTTVADQADNPDKENVVDHKGRRVVVSAQVPAPTIAASFEATRQEVFKKAVQEAYSKESKKYSFKEMLGKTIYGGISGFEVLDEGWLQQESSFYLQMRVWVFFSKPVENH